jgi:hypothetical protein
MSGSLTSFESGSFESGSFESGSSESGSSFGSGSTFTSDPVPAAVSDAPESIAAIAGAVAVVLAGVVAAVYFGLKKRRARNRARFDAGRWSLL